MPGAIRAIPVLTGSGESRRLAQAQESEGPTFESQLCFLLPVLPGICFLSPLLVKWEKEHNLPNRQRG